MRFRYTLGYRYKNSMQIARSRRLNAFDINEAIVCHFVGLWSGDGCETRVRDAGKQWISARPYKNTHLMDGP